MFDLNTQWKYRLEEMWDKHRNKSFNKVIYFLCFGVASDVILRFLYVWVYIKFKSETSGNLPNDIPKGAGLSESNRKHRHHIVKNRRQRPLRFSLNQFIKTLEIWKKVHECAIYIWWPWCIHAIWDATQSFFQALREIRYIGSITARVLKYKFTALFHIMCAQ